MTVVFAYVGSGGSQPFDIAVHLVHYTVLIIYNIFNFLFTSVIRILNLKYYFDSPLIFYCPN